MTTITADSGKKDKKRDPDFINAEIAMQRAALKARERAKRSGTGVVVVKDGDIVEERPEVDR